MWLPKADVTANASSGARMRTIAALVIVARGLFGAELTVNGVASDCILPRVPPGNLPVQKIQVLIFDSAKVPVVLELLRKLGHDDPFNHQETLEESDTLYRRIKQLVTKVPSLAKVETNVKGRFHAQFTSASNLLVLSFDATREDRPFFTRLVRSPPADAATLMLNSTFAGIAKRQDLGSRSPRESADFTAASQNTACRRLRETR